MIFAVPGHIDMIRNGLFWYDGIDNPDWTLKAIKEYCTHRTQFLAGKSGIPQEVKDGLWPLILKTQTRRLNRGIYQVGRDYAVQRKRGVKAEIDIRIVMDSIWKEEVEEFADECEVVISQKNAWAEGGYTPTEFEQVFQKLNPKWDGQKRWIFVFHVIEVQK